MFTFGNFFNGKNEVSKERTQSLLQYDSEIVENQYKTLEFQESSLSQAFNLGYPLATHGFSLSQLYELGGINLGSHSENSQFAAISFIPVGKGGFIHFGGCITNIKWFTDEAQISYDIANMIESGLIDSLVESSLRSNARTISGVKSVQHSLGPNEQFDSKMRIDFHPADSNTVNLYVYSTSLHNHKTVRDQFESPWLDSFDFTGIRGPINNPFPVANLSSDEIKIDFDANKLAIYDVFVTLSDTNKRAFEEVSIFWNQSFSPVCNDAGFIDSFIQKVVIDLQSAGIEVNILDSVANLKDFITQEPEGNLIVASGILPASVHSLENNSLAEWLRGGGLMIWIGETIGALSSSNLTETIGWEHHENLQWQGEEKIWGGSYIIRGERGNHELRPSTISNGLGLGYSSVRISPYLDAIEPLGGLSIGPVSDEFDRSSISFVPVELGGVILFGGCLGATESTDSPALISNYIVRILASGVIRSEESNNSTFLIGSITSERFVPSEIIFSLTREVKFASVTIYNEQELYVIQAEID